MGNSQAKESRSGAGYQAEYPESSPRNRRMSRGDMAFLSLGSASPRDRNRQREDAPFEHRETRAEREARRLERERATRAKIRERSLKEEHVDGGYLVTLGTYTGTEDFSKPVVRQLQIERRLAPFWRGLNDWSENWAEHQLIAAARGLPIPAADAPPDPELVPQPLPESSSTNLQNLTVPLGPRTLSAASDRSGSGANSGVASPSTGAASKIKPRAKAIAMALTGGSRDSSSTDLARQEASLPPDPFVNGQALEVYLYKDAADCPICFLSYPPYLNRTRCCDQPICTECFVQIKRADPHLPEHHPDGEARDPNQGLNPEDPPELLISEPSACPYCQQPEFGVTYEPPHFRRGLVYSMAATSVGSSTPMSSQSSLHSTLSPTQPHQPGRKRGHSLSANAPNVVTTDRIRPDWATKLAAARQHQARRAAAATALHTAAFLVGSSDQRSILRSGRFGRRNTGSGSEGALTPLRSGLILTGNEDASSPNRERNPDGHQRTRMDELEDMMFMEAVRLSLAAEEERKKKEAKAMRKEAKKQEKAEQKALKKQGKDIYGNSGGASGSSLSLNLGRKRGNSVASNLRVEATVQGAAQATSENTISEGTAGLPASSNDSKGKGVNRETPESQHESSIASSPPVASPSGRTTSHLRHISNASSLGSSLADTPSGSYSGPEFHADGARVAGAGDDSDRENANESMFNFRSLAELVGVDIENGQRTDGEGTEQTQSQEKDTSGRPLSRVSEEDKDTDAIFPVDEVDAVTTETKPPQQAPSGEISLDQGNPSVSLGAEETLTGDSAKLQSLSRTEDKVMDKPPVTEQAQPSITELPVLRD